MRRPFFHEVDLGPEKLTAREVMRRLGVRSRRTLTAYIRRGLLPQGERVRVGRAFTRRLWSDPAVTDAQIALAVHGLPGPQARRLEDCRERGIQQRRAKRSVAELAGQVLSRLGAQTLATALRPLSLDAIGLDAIDPSRHATVQTVLTKTLGGQA